MPGSGLWIPTQLKRGRKFIRVVFYVHRSGYIQVGFPDQFPLPRILKKEGFQKVVCTNAHEVDLWDKRLREQEQRHAEMSDLEREAIEGPIREKLKAELRHKMATSRNNVNREFCRWSLKQIEASEIAKKMKSEAYMHIVGFEDGH